MLTSTSKTTRLHRAFVVVVIRNKSMLGRDITIAISSSALLGAAIWFASPLVTGSIELWDAESSYYLSSLFVVGCLVGGVFPRQVWGVLPGIVIGQLIYATIYLPSGPLAVLGIAHMLGYAIFSLLGAYLVSHARLHMQN